MFDDRRTSSIVMRPRTTETLRNNNDDLTVTVGQSDTAITTCRLANVPLSKVFSDSLR